MSALYENLAGLHRRLQIINHHSTHQNDQFKLEDLEINPHGPKYICAECAWTTSKNAGALARHFTFKHASHRKCRDCTTVCEDQEELNEHRSQKHRHLCPRCQRMFATVQECGHHEPCDSQYRRAQEAENDAPSHRVVDQPIGGKAPASGQSLLDRRNSVQSGCCPDPGCQLTFLDFGALYEHYVRLHPLCIVHPGHSKPFKCPFCQKRYQHDRFLPGHVRTHKPKSLSIPGIKDAEIQEALIRQSRVAMANRQSQSHAGFQGQADRTLNDEECSIPIKEGDYSLVLEGCAICIDIGIEKENPNTEQSDQTDVQESQRLRKTTPIGFVLQACPATSSDTHPANKRSSVSIIARTDIAEPELSDSMDLDDDYSERFALDDHELPSRTRSLDCSIVAAQICETMFHQGLSCEIIRALRMQHSVEVSEVVDLLTYFLDYHQRLFVLKQLGSIDPTRHDSDILEALHGTVFKDLLDAWIEFKRLAIRLAPQPMIQANDQGNGPTKSVTWALLQYCLKLEDVIYGSQVNIAHHFLRDPRLHNFVPTPDTPLPQLISAPADRVKKRIVDDPSTVFTNEMILRGVREYVELLQTTFKPLYPIAAGHEGLWRELRLI